jgi:hypothetical protein
LKSPQRISPPDTSSIRHNYNVNFAPSAFRISHPELQFPHFNFHIPFTPFR